MKLIKTILLSTICIASLVSCNQTRDENTIVVGASAAPHAEILEVTKDILSFNNEMLIKNGTTVTERIVQIAKQNGKLRELALNI